MKTRKHQKSMKHSTNPETFLDPCEKKTVEAAIKKAEKMTSAEIKLIIVRHCWGKIEEKASRIFYKNGLNQTKNKNSVLIMLVLANREFIIYGDEGIHQHAGQDFWDDTRNTMLEFFKNNQFTEGLVRGIESIASKLKLFFPYTEDDINEVSNDIAYED